MAWAALGEVSARKGTARHTGRNADYERLLTGLHSAAECVQMIRP